MNRALDVGLAAAAAVLLLPVALLVSVLVKATSRGPVFHRALRVGRGGAPFELIKFRTMRAGAAGPRVAGAYDARSTRIGGVLRRLHLDELPQLLHVLGGRMSLVGPRPEDPGFVDADDLRWREILTVRPGITGPTQLVFAGIEREALVGSDPERTYERDLLPAKIAADLEYVRTRSFGTDCRILLRTVGAWLPGRMRAPDSVAGPA